MPWYAFGMAIGPAKLQWKPNIFSAREALKAEGLIAKTPFESKKAALEAIEGWKQKNGGGEDSVFLVTPGETGWEVHRFSESRRTQADLGELKIDGGGELHPQSFIIDSRGKVALVAQTKLKEVPRSSFVEPVAQLGRRVLPLVEPTVQLNHGHNVKWTPKVAFRPGRDI